MGRRNSISESTRLSPVRHVMLGKIVANSLAQIRATVDAFRVDEYAEAMRSGASFPPVVVFKDEGDPYYLADGFQRLEAARLAKRHTIKCEVRTGGLRDAILHAVGANSAHGLPRSNADKRKAVLTLLGDHEWGRWSNREIARRAAVSEAFVRELRRPSANGSQMKDGGGRVVRRGRTPYVMRTSRIGDSRRLDPKARDLIRNTDIPDDRRAVALLTSKTADVQVRAAELIAGGEARNVTHALKQIRYDGKVSVALADAVRGRHALWYVDPPWAHESDGVSDSAAEHYPVLPTDEIVDLLAPVKKRSTDDAVLFLWAVNPMLPDALRVMAATGFEYRTNISWVKRGETGGLRPGKGFYLLGTHELLLIGTRGSFLPKVVPPSVLEAPRGAHSAKPEAARELVERMYPGLPSYVELFARRQLEPPWIGWGNEPAAAGEGR